MRTLTLLLTLILSGTAQAGTVCINNLCFSCDGSTTCINGYCTCNGVAVDGKSSLLQQGPCAGQETVIHNNGGGKVATTASVNESVYVSADSAVCGYAVISGATRLLNGSTVNGSANISGRSTLDKSTVNGSAAVSDSSVGQSTLNGSATVLSSDIVNSVLNGGATVESSEVTNSVLNGSVKVVGRQIHGRVLND